MIQQACPASHPQRGFSLIEVLVALVVLAVGLLGLALLQTMNLRYTKSAEQRTQAVNLAGELLDTMRSNRSQLSQYATVPNDFASVVVPANGCAWATGMSAAVNLARWRCQVLEALGADARATVVIAADDTVTVTIAWDESRVAANNGQVSIRSTL